MKVAQSCLILCDTMDYTVHEILQARILEWVVKPSPGDLPNPGIEPWSPTLQADSLPSEPPGKPHVRRPGFKFKFCPLLAGEPCTTPFIFSTCGLMAGLKSDMCGHVL